jgi:hypothetical protein
VVSSEGRAWADSEWADEGSVVTVRVESTRLGFPVQTVLAGFSAEGGEVLRYSLAEGWALVRVTGPTTVYVRWVKDYTPLYVLAAVAGVIALGAALYLARGRLPTPTRVAAAMKEATQVKPVPAGVAAPAEGTQVLSPEQLEGELSRIEEEVRVYQEYLQKLEAMRAEGKVADAVYERLKAEYSEKLRELLSRRASLEEARKKLKEGSSGVSRER